MLVALAPAGSESADAWAEFLDELRAAGCDHYSSPSATPRRSISAPWSRFPPAAAAEVPDPPSPQRPGDSPRRGADRDQEGLLEAVRCRRRAGRQGRPDLVPGPKLLAFVQGRIEVSSHRPNSARRQPLTPDSSKVSECRPAPPTRANPRPRIYTRPGTQPRVPKPTSLLNRAGRPRRPILGVGTMCSCRDCRPAA